MNKPNYNEIIKTTRKAKGLTQQELADKAAVSLRTVQRIEKGTEEISGFTLRQICKVLDIPLENLIMQNVDQISIDNNQIGSIRNLYLSALSFIIFPFLGFIVPAAVGFSKPNRSQQYNKNLRFILLLHGLQSLLIIAFPILFLLTTTLTTPQQIDVKIGGDNTQRIIETSPEINNTPYFIYIIAAYYLVNLWIVARKIAHLYDNKIENEEE